MASAGDATIRTGQLGSALATLSGSSRETVREKAGSCGAGAFFTDLVGQAAEKRTVVELLAEGGIDVSIAGAVQALRDGVGQLLSRAQEVGAVREDVRLDTVVALLTSACQGAVQAGWDQDLQRRTLAVIFDGLRAGRRRE